MTKSKWFIPGIIVAVLLLVGVWFGGTYNGLVASREKVNKASSDLQVQYQRRLNLIDNLVTTVKGSSTFEQDTLTKVVEARSKIASQIDLSKATPEQIQAYVDAQSQMSSPLSKLLAVAESYPDIKSTAAYQDLMSQLEGTENRVAVATSDLNEATRQYNTQVQTIPTSIVAGLTGFQVRPQFQAQSGATTVPKVNFGN